MCVVGGRRRGLGLILILAGLAACSRRKPSAAPPGPIVTPRPDVATAVASFRQQQPGAGIAFDSYTGYVKELGGFVGPPAADPNQPEAAARAFLTANAALFGLPAGRETLRLAQSSTATGERAGTITGRFLRFQQIDRDLPVHEGEVVVHLTASSRVRTVHNAYRPLDAVTGGFKINREAAIERAKQAIAPRKAPPEVQARAVVFARQRTGLRAWRVNLEGWTVIIDGDTGEVLLSRDDARYATASVFRENTTVDNGNTITGTLTNLGTSTTLSGTQFNIVNDSVALVTSSTQDFTAAPSSANFDDQMVYFHLEGMVAYFAGLGIAGPGTSLLARTRVAQSIGSMECQALFIPATNRFLFGIPSSGCSAGCLPPGQFADVICHEYTHFVLTMAGVTGRGTESDAIHEGTADYFSDSRLGNPCTGEGLKIGTPCFRNANTCLRFPQDMAGEAHSGGEVWVSTLWDLRTTLGASVADRAISAGMAGLPAAPTFDVYAGNILSAGAAFYLSLVDDDGWANLARILTAQNIVTNGQRVFCNHGIPAPFGTFVDMSVTGASGASVNQTVTAPAGMVVDKSRGCRGGFDILAPGGFEDMKYFLDHRSQLTGFAETVGSNNLNVTFSVPGGCSGVNPISLTYRLYTKPGP